MNKIRIELIRLHMACFYLQSIKKSMKSKIEDLDS